MASALLEHRVSTRAGSLMPLPPIMVSSFGGASVKRIHRPVNDEGKTLSVGSYKMCIRDRVVVPPLVSPFMDTRVTKPS